MKIFLATSFSFKVDEKGDVDPEFKQLIQEIIGRFEVRGDEVFCAIRAENWKIATQDPTEAFKTDFMNIEKCDKFMAMLDDRISAGVQLEIGYALALKKPVTLLVDSRINLGWSNKALINLPNVGLEVIN